MLANASIGALPSTLACGLVGCRYSTGEEPDLRPVDIFFVARNTSINQRVHEFQSLPKNRLSVFRISEVIYEH